MLIKKNNMHSPYQESSLTYTHLLTVLTVEQSTADFKAIPTTCTFYSAVPNNNSVNYKLILQYSKKFRTVSERSSRSEDDTCVLYKRCWVKHLYSKLVTVSE